MKSLELLKKLEGKLTADKQIERYCKDSLSWIRARRADWESDQVRVGVIGVTSSGKSTLINAVLGADVLSKAVVPTTGQLIYCTYGDKEAITVKFADGTKKTFSGAEFDYRNLMEYSDTRYNPDNEKRVLSIEIASPKFDLEPDVVLIDSPGLDAYGQETHEKLTLETMVPTIDVCIYVTTMKANNDQKMKSVLDVLAKYDCPVIIVQNMLDTVRTSSRGDKSRKVLAKEHLERAHRIIEKSDIKDKKDVAIVQMSAEYARQWRVNREEYKVTKEQYNESHYEQFITYVKNVLAIQRPRIEKARKESIRACIYNIRNLIESQVADDASVNVSTDYEYAGLKESIAEFNDNQLTEYEKLVKGYESAANGIKHRITNKGDVNIGIQHTNIQVKKLGDGILKLIEQGNEFIVKCAGEVNIPSRDLMKSVMFQPLADITAKKKLVMLERKVKDGGLGAALKRSFGMFSGDVGMGYHTEYDRRYELDEKATSQLIEQQLEFALAKYTTVFEDWREKNYHNAMSKIGKVVGLADELYAIRKETALKDGGFGGLKFELAALLEENGDSEDTDAVAAVEGNGIAGSAESIIRAGYETKLEQMAEVDVSGYMASVIKLSKNMSRNIYNSVAKSLLKNVDCMEHTPIVVGWDDDCIKEFLWQTAIKDYVMYNAETGMGDIPKGDKRCFFVLVNTIQFGAAKKQIWETKLQSMVQPSDYIVWVVQDFGELLAGDNVVEGLQNMLTFVNDEDILCKGCIWLSHENPIYNLVFLEHQMNPVTTAEKENSLLRAYNDKYGSFLDKQVVENIMRIIKDVKIN